MKIAWILTYSIVLIWSAINPTDYFTWFLEVLPALIGFAVMAVTYKKFKLTNLTYTLLGAVLSLSFFSKTHDSQLQNLGT